MEGVEQSEVEPGSEDGGQVPPESREAETRPEDPEAILNELRQAGQPVQDELERRGWRHHRGAEASFRLLDHAVEILRQRLAPAEILDKAPIVIAALEDKLESDSDWWGIARETERLPEVREWRDIEVALSNVFPELASWLEEHHETPSVVRTHLDSGVPLAVLTLTVRADVKQREAFCHKKRGGSFLPSGLHPDWRENSDHRLGDDVELFKDDLDRLAANWQRLSTDWALRRYLKLLVKFAAEVGMESEVSSALSAHPELEKRVYGRRRSKSSSEHAGT